MAKPVTVWATADEDGAFCMFGMEPVKNGDGTYGGMMLSRMDVDLGLGECREYVMIPASEYAELVSSESESRLFCEMYRRRAERQPTADLSHADIVRIIAEIAHQDWLVALKEDSLAPKGASVRVAAQFVELAIAAARKIESEAK